MIWWRQPSWSHSFSWAPGLGLLAPADSPGPGRPAGHLDVQFGHLAAVTGLAVVVDRRDPGVVGHRSDRLVKGLVDPGVDRERDVAGHQAGHERRHRPGAVGPHHHGMRHHRGIVAATMPAAERLGQLRHRQVDHVQLIGRRVARSQHPGQRLTGGIEGAEHGMEPVATLEMAGRCLLVRRVDLYHRGVNIEHHLADHRRSHLGPQHHRAAARADRSTPSTTSSMSSTARQIVGADATSPNKSGWSRSAAISETHSPPPANITASWVMSRPRS